jgi:hypothetical protein
LNIAHGVTGGGPNLEALLIAVPMVGLGMLFFFQKSASLPVSLVLIVLGLVVGYGSVTFLTQEPVDSHGHTPQRDFYASALIALCDAGETAERRPAKAERTFYDHAHQPLHELADESAGADRAVAARLLESKNEVEAVLEEVPPDGERLAAAINALAIETGSAMQALEMEAPSCA